MNLRRLFHDAKGQEIMARLGGEAAAVGLSLGFTVEDIFGIAPDKWMGAGRGDKAAMEDVIGALRKQAEDMEENAHSGMAQDLAKGRRTEIEYMNGYIAVKAAEAGLAAPTHDAIVSLITKMKRRTAVTGGEAMDYLLNPIDNKGNVPC
jgi:2-dehydropantoate 2-reductase